MKRKKEIITRWALLLSDREFSPKIFEKHFIFEDGQIKLFSTRKEARKYNIQEYGYIKDRKDLRIYPHFWRMPNVVKVKITIEQL